jgi:hypothetical protein
MNTRYNRLSFALLSVAVAGAVMISSCDNGKHEGSDEAKDTVKVDEAANKAQKILFALPSPMEMALLLKNSGSSYSKEILNPVETASKYSTNAQKALNLGVYGTDLAYTAIYNQTQESVFYMAATKKMADGLGITSAFSDKMASRMQDNLENNDSILSIVSDSYYETDAFLKENDRASMSAMIVAGGWIEGLHLATRIAEKAPKNEQLKQRVADEKLTLGNVMGLLQSYPNDESIKMILDELAKLKTAYDKIPEAGTNVTATTDEKTNVTTIGGDSKITMTDEQFKEIAATVKSIREGLVKP